MGQRLTLAVQGKMDVVKINGYDDDDDELEASAVSLSTSAPWAPSIGKEIVLARPYRILCCLFALPVVILC